ncbi:MAG: hypothetical protein AAGA93_05975 [Actinomycetota bacterium]
MELRTWIVGDLVSLRQRLAGGVLTRIPVDRRAERVDDGGIAPTYILWHLARHHDVAVNRVLREVDETVHAWTDRVGVGDDLWRGLAEGEDTELVDSLDPEAVEGYALAVLDGTRSWLDEADLSILERPTLDTDTALASLGAPEDRMGWLYDMWRGRPASFFLQWEAVGHGFNHLGELTSIRNRMGLSPF